MPAPELPPGMPFLPEQNQNDDEQQSRDRRVKACLGCASLFTVAVVGAGIALGNFVNAGLDHSSSDEQDNVASYSPTPEITESTNETYAEETDEPAKTVEPSSIETAGETSPDPEPEQTKAPQETSQEYDPNSSCPWSPSNPQPLSGNSITIYGECGEPGAARAYTYWKLNPGESPETFYLDPGTEVELACRWPDGNGYLGVIAEIEDTEKAVLIPDSKVGWAKALRDCPTS